MHVRQMNEEDVDAAAIINSNEFSADRAFSQEKFQKAFEKSIAAIAAEENNKIIGYLFAVHKELSWTPNTAYIQLLGVDKTHQKKGVGSAMLERCLETLKQKGYKNVELIVPVNREESQALYKKFGFETSAFKMKKKL